jgi:hypothetical protein
MLKRRSDMQTGPPDGRCAHRHQVLPPTKPPRSYCGQGPICSRAETRRTCQYVNRDGEWLWHWIRVVTFGMTLGLVVSAVVILLDIRVHW